MARKHHGFYLFLVLTLVVIDQLTKNLIVRHFFLGQVLPIIPDFFNLTYIKNPGMVFGLLARGGEWARVFLLIIPVSVALGLIVFYFRLGTGEFWSRLSVSLILGGAVSNLLDRFRLGYVVDFLDFHWKNEAHYPSFNAAGAFICAGVFILFLATKTSQRKAVVSV